MFILLGESFVVHIVLLKTFQQKNVLMHVKKIKKNLRGFSTILLV